MLEPIVKTIEGTCSQLLGGILLVVAKSRIYGAVIAAGSFLASTVVIFMTGQVGFGLFRYYP